MKTRPLKSTIWVMNILRNYMRILGRLNLVCSYYNGGPGYLQITLLKKELNDFWELRQYLRKRHKDMFLSLRC